MGELDGKTALITGGARGFGRACALLMAAEGADVVIADLGDSVEPGSTRRIRDAVAEVEQRGRRALGLEVDVTRASDCRKAAEDTVRTFGRIDILHANAGISGRPALTWEIDENDWDRVLAVDLKGAWLTAKYVVPHMIRQGGGKIVFTASRSGVRAEETFAHYVAAKFGLVGLTKTLAMELGPWEINVNAICPSGMGKLTDETYHPSEWGPPLVPDPPPATAAQFDREYGRLNLFESVGRAEFAEVAQGVLWLVSDRARLVTGTTLLMDAGYVAKRGG